MRTHASCAGWAVIAIALAVVVPVGAEPPPPQSPGAELPGPSLLLPATPPPGPLASAVADSAPVEDQSQNGAFLLSVDYLLMQPRSNLLDFAIVGPTNPFGPVGDVRSLSWGLANGIRAGGGYQLPGEGWEVGLYYTYLHSNATDGAAAGPNETLYPTLTHPGTVQQASTALANSKLNYNVIDLEFGKRFRTSATSSVRVFAGPRFANIDQEIDAVYNGVDANLDRVRSRSDFTGFGARIGAEGNWSVFHGLGVYARGSASLLEGSFRTSLNEATNNNTSTIVDVTNRFQQVVPVLELGMGLSYQWGNLRVTAGYELVNWFNQVNQIDFVDDSAVGKLGRRTGDLGLDGLVLRALWTY